MIQLNKILFAALAACLGTACLGSCTAEDVADQGEPQQITRTKLKLQTRTDEETKLPKEGRIYIFNNEGKCTNIVETDDINNQKAINITPGKCKLVAIASNDLSVYDLPDKENVTDSSIVTLKDGKALTDLMLRTDTLTLDQGETTYVSLTLERKIICIKNITVEKLPSDVISTEMKIAPMYKSIRLNGKYTDETSNVRLSLTKDTVTGNWTNNGDSVFWMPSKGNPTITLILKSDSAIKEYAYQIDHPMKKNYYERLNVNYKEGVITYFSGSLLEPEWEGVDSVSFEIGDDNITTADSVNYNTTPVVGRRFKEYYVVSADSEARTAVLLRKKGNAGYTSKADMGAKIEQISKPEDVSCGSWRLPTLQECTRILSECIIYQADKTKRDIKNDEIEPGAYYCTADGKLCKLELFLKNGVRYLSAPVVDCGYDSSIIFRPVIDISY